MLLELSKKVLLISTLIIKQTKVDNIYLQTKKYLNVTHE